MPVTNLGTMRTAVRTRIGNPATDGFFTDAQVDDMVNEGLQVSATEKDWPWLETSTTFATVVGQGAYSVPAGWQKTKALVFPDQDPLILLSIQEILSITHQGEPAVYAIFEDQLELRPLPNAVETVSHLFIQTEPELVADGDAPLMPIQFRYAIVAYATHLAQMRQGKMGEADRALQEYQQWVQRMADNRRRSTVTTRVRVRPGSAL